MRILRGKWRGRSIPFPKGAPTRPLTEKAREALFNILSHRWVLEGCTVIDLFAGSGTVGLEFLSRGAQFATFVEKDPLAAKQLRQLLQAWNAPAVLYEMDVLKFLEKQPTPALFIFAGPPFRFWQKRQLIEKILYGGWLLPGGCFILEHPLYETYTEYPEFWRCETYVSSGLSFFLAPAAGKQ
ncbi:MAG: RsmD family RNA methyltransferase [Bacteroidia bacterium]|nr:RsmD family RNA methyltransferase [Bacteroidia bacterium]MCX7763913.1 RsmD family RNA methyltransferase [Bacteroidia bacterium]MDW8057821.1 RsmD family RNA methyltransferase [Bacteroidia bacterium]